MPARVECQPSIVQGLKIAIGSMGSDRPGRMGKGGQWPVAN